MPWRTAKLWKPSKDCLVPGSISWKPSSCYKLDLTKYWMPQAWRKVAERSYADTLQHLRALKAMDYEPSGPFITSILELKLDTTTMFEWQKHSQSSTEVPHYQHLLEFIDLLGHRPLRHQLSSKQRDQAELDWASPRRVQCQTDLNLIHHKHS